MKEVVKEIDSASFRFCSLASQQKQTRSISSLVISSLTRSTGGVKWYITEDDDELNSNTLSE